MERWEIGFSNVGFETKYEVINLSDFEKVNGVITTETLAKAGLVKKTANVKILAKGELKKAFNVKAHKFSEKAKAAIEKAGGKVEVLAL